MAGRHNAQLVSGQCSRPPHSHFLAPAAMDLLLAAIDLDPLSRPYAADAAPMAARAARRDGLSAATKPTGRRKSAFRAPHMHVMHSKCHA